MTKKKTYDNILIGGSGFIGSALAEALSLKGESLLSISRNASETLPIGVEEYILDLEAAVLPPFPTAETVFILVGQNSNDFNASSELKNLEKLVDALNLIQPKKVLYLSSVLAYGERKDPAEETAELNPIDPYSRYKADAEALLKARISPQSKLAILRLANVYGGVKNKGFIGFLMKHLLAQSTENIIVNGQGDQERDYIFLDDVINGMLAVKKGLAEDDVVNIASGKSSTLLELVACVEQASHTKLPYETGGKGAQEIHCSRIDNTKLREKYHFIPAHTLFQGLQKTLTRYQEANQNAHPKKKVLLIGGEGFIGRNISAKLASRYQCFSVGENESIFAHDRKDIFLQTNPYQEKIPGKYDVIIHLIDHKISVDNFLEEEEKFIENIPLESTTHMILFSSAVVYANPDSDYGKRKQALENFYYDYCQKQGILLTIFRPFNVFGPFQIPYRQGSLVANLIYNSLLSKTTEINDMDAKRDFIYVEDVVRLVEVAIAKKLSGTFDIGAGKLTSVRELIGHLEGALGDKMQILDRQLREESQIVAKADHSWDETHMLNLDEGLAKTAAFYRLHKALIDTERGRF